MREILEKVSNDYCKPTKQLMKVKEAKLKKKKIIFCIQEKIVLKLKKNEEV